MGRNYRDTAVLSRAPSPIRHRQTQRAFMSRSLRWVNLPLHKMIVVAGGTSTMQLAVQFEVSKPMKIALCKRVCLIFPAFKFFTEGNPPTSQVVKLY